MSPKKSVSTTLLASCHRYIADVGGTCCWLSGSDTKHGVGQVRWWRAHFCTKLDLAGGKMGCAGGMPIERRGSCDLSLYF